MQPGIKFTRENLLGIISTTLLILFIVTLPRYTDVSKTWFFILILIGFFFLLLNLKQLRDTSTAERIFFSVIILNFLWMAFSYYYNGEPGRGASFLWSRHFYFLFLIPLFFLFRKINISDKVILLSLFFSVSLSITDILIDVSQGVDYRVQGMNPNAFGPIQLCLSGILFFFYINKTGRWQKSIALVGLVLAITTVIFSQSRSTWIPIPLLTVFFVFYMAHSLSTAKKMLVILAAFTLISSSYFLPIVNARINNAMNTISAYFTNENFQDVSNPRSFGIRMELWKLGWNIFLENPVTGAGLGSVQVVTRDHWGHYEVNKAVAGYKYVHNQYIAALATRGIPGLILLLLVLFLPIYIAMSKKSLDRDSEIARLSIILICLVYIVGCFAEDHFEGKSATMFVSLMLALLLSKINPGRVQSAEDSVS